MSIYVPFPGDDFLEWANNLSTVFLDYTVPLATDEEKWHEWATHFILCNPSIANIPLPNLSLYPLTKDWKKWAELFCNNIYTTL